MSNGIILIKKQDFKIKPTVSELFGILSIVFAVTQPINAQISNGMNASDLIGQYTTAGGFSINWTQSAINNNQGSVNALGFNTPEQVAIDKINHRLFVTELNNSRILVYNLDANNNWVDKTPDFVLGQSSFTTNTAATTQNGLRNPTGAIYDANNNRLFVADRSNHRVLVFDVASITNGENAVAVLGQTTFTNGTSALSQSRLNSPDQLFYDGGNNRLFVSDRNNNRVLVFDVASITNGENAINVLGQANFTSNTSATTATGITGPQGVSGLAYSASNNRLFVVNYAGNRVLVYDVATITNGEAAINVLGQSSFTTSTAATSQTGMSTPYGITYDDVNNRLFVAENGNNRILVFDVSTITNGEAAINVLGQSNFTTGTAATSQSRLSSPENIFYDSDNGKLYVPEYGNHRVVVYNLTPPPTVSGTVTNVACRGASTGAINLTVSDGVAPYSYNWGGGITTQNRTGLAAGTYTVTVTDAALVTTTANFTVTQPLAALSVSGTQVNVACFGGATGTINITATGGTAPYTYLWNDGIVSEDRTVLPAATYTVTVTDANTCTTTATFNITQPAAALSVTGTQGNVACYSGATGTINITASGGTGAYSYLWNDGIVSEDRTVLPAATYTVTVTDANVCTTTASFTITQPSAALSVSGTQVNVSCFSASTGSINIIAIGGTGTKTYNWGGAITTQNRTSLAAGSYTVTVTDANACTTTASFTITQPSTTLSVTPSVTQPSCFAFGGITLSVSGGTAPYTYDWADITGTNNTKDRSGLAAGSYSVTVTDSQGCTVSSGTITLNAPTSCAPINICNTEIAKVFSIAPDPSNTSYTWTVPAGAVIVSGQGTPQITVNLTGVTAGAYQVCVVALNACGTSAQTCQDVNIRQPQATATANPVCSGGTVQLFAGGSGTYAWSGPSGFTSSSSNPTILNASAAAHNGIYSLTVTDTYGCVATSSVNVSVSPSPSVSVVTTNTSCDQTTGAIDVTVSGGTPAYTYTWNNGTSAQDLSSIAAGTYQLTVIDAAGCSVNTAYSVVNTNGPTLSETHVNVTCANGTNGSINLTVSGGTAPYTYIWSNGAITEDISSLAEGTYIVTVTDATGCTASLSIIVTAPTAVQTDFTKINVSCFGQSTGSIDLIVSGGTSPYSYSWRKNGVAYGGNVQDLSTLGTGTYAVTVTDASSCTTTNSIVITEPSAALSATTATTNVSCNGGSNGQVILTVSGGTAPYTYSWTGPSSFTATTKDIVNRPAGTYNVTITDANGCAYPVTNIVIRQPTALAISSTTVSNVSCYSGTNGSINITVTGGTLPYAYAWNNGTTTEDLSSIAVGSYVLTITDAEGCTAVSSTISVNEPSASLSATPSVTNATCYGSSNGSINLSVSGGTSPYTYNWSNGATTQNISALAAGTYFVTVTDANSCTTVSTVTVGQSTELSVSAVITNVLCNGASTGAINLTTSGGTSPYTYNWTGGITTEDRSGLVAGTFNVTITDNQSCTSIQTYAITQPSALSLSMANTNISCFGGSNGAVNLTVSGGATPYTYAWSNAATTEDITGLAVGSYSVTVRDANNCSSTMTSAAITDPTALVATANVDKNVTCFEGNDGEATVTPTGGTAPYGYLWSNGLTTQSATSLSAGSYSVTVTDLSGCTTTVGSVTISQPSTNIIIYTETTNTSSCGGNTGAINLTVTMGTAPYTFNWTGSTSIGNTANPTGLAAGTYNVTVTDASGCSNTSSITVGTAQALTATATIYNIGCHGTDGQVYAVVSGGVEPYTYAWSSGGATTAYLTGLSAGSYTVTVTDANNCTTSATGILTASTNCAPPVAINDTTSTPIDTPVSGTVATNDSDPDNLLSELEFYPMGEPDLNQGSIVWSNTFDGSYTFTPASGFTGVVNIPYRVCDPTGLCANAILTIIVGCDVTASVIAGNQTICSGGDPFAFTVTTAATGMGALTYQWQNSTDNISFTNISGAISSTYDIPSGLTQTTYYRVVVTSTLSSVVCKDTSNTLTVTVNSTPSTPSVTSPLVNSCPATTVDLSTVVAALTPSVAGGVFEWHVTNDPNSAFVSSPHTVGVGTYYLFEKSPAGCYSSALAVTVNINVCCPTPQNIPLIIQKYVLRPYGS